MKTPQDLLAIFDKHGTDKGRDHQFHVPYALFLRPYLHLQPSRLLEIGVGKHGASLRSWQDVFDDVQLTAIDINKRARRRVPDGCRLFLGDQGNANFVEGVGKQRGPFDVIIDDGSHRVDHQQISFNSLWPYLSPGGLYVIEDIHTSREELYNPEARYGYPHNPKGWGNTINWMTGKVRQQILRHPRDRRKVSPMLISWFLSSCFIVKVST